MATRTVDGLASGAPGAKDRARREAMGKIAELVQADARPDAPGQGAHGNTHGPGGAIVQARQRLELDMSSENEYLARERADFLRRASEGRQLYDGTKWRDWTGEEIANVPIAVVKYISYLERNLKESRELLTPGNQLLAERINDGRDDFARGSIYASEEHFDHG